ncbi:MAG TPA: MBL fold metallo-hydrolase [Tepidisphaeraceae bacterium]|jgi:phosphoribosyl 1,2-cyclic phosphate phosphodiesterase|nr:MBL fold metallo-hydrolase [Tepidisphaeraceae bacterium]
MRIQLLGTAAAEGWPAAYCDCHACTEARRRGGPNIRTRSGALIGDDLKIDHNGDTVTHAQRQSLANVRSILFTHEHADHLAPQELHWLQKWYTSTRVQEPVAIYGNVHVLAAIRREHSHPMKAMLDLRLMRPLEPFATHAGDRVLPLPAEHSAPGALMLKVTRGGKHLLYGHDSGLFPEATLDALNGEPLDVALLECTSGSQRSDNRHHLNVPGVLQTVEALRRRGAVTDATFVVVTHFSHNGGVLHEELIRTFLPHGIAVAFDGMVIDV